MFSPTVGFGLIKGRVYTNLNIIGTDSMNRVYRIEETRRIVGRDMKRGPGCKLGARECDRKEDSYIFCHDVNTYAQPWCEDLASVDDRLVRTIADRPGTRWWWLARC